MNSSTTHSIRMYPAAGNRLQFLAGAVNRTFGIIDEYVDHYRRNGSLDVPYFYNERATLSLLVGGIWRASPENMVLEEYGSDKCWENEAYRGRQDLWFRVSGRECFAEAKQGWPSLGSARLNLEPYLCTLADEAHRAHMNNEQADFALGIVFLVPYITKSRIGRISDAMDAYHKRLGRGIEDCHKRAGGHFLWGRYIRSDLVGEAGLCAWRDGRICATPALDIVFALHSADANV